MQRKFIKLVLLILLIVTTYKYRSEIFIYYPCDKPVGYTVVKVDERFGVDKEQINNQVKNAAGIWNSALEREHFVQDENGKLKISLVYDKRQQELFNIKVNKEKVTQKQNELKLELESYYENAKNLSQELELLNEEIKAWNEKGGAPEEEYAKLVDKRDELSLKINEHNIQSNNLNSQINALNGEIDEFNSIIKSYNKLLTIMPEEGIYKPSTSEIIVYIYEDELRFVHTMAHELGHQIGLEHTNDRESIMNPVTSSTTILASEDISQLKSACQPKSVSELLEARARNVFEYVTSVAIQMLQ